MWVIEAMTQLEADSLHGLVVAVAKIFVQADNGIYDVIVERGYSNNPTDELPPVLPHQLVKIGLGSFHNVVTAHKARLEKRLSSEQIHQIRKAFIDLPRAYREEPLFKIAVDENSDAITGFSKG